MSAKKVCLSVVVPAYNHGQYLNRSLGSIFNQGVDNLEVVLINDASEDETEEIVKKLSKEKIVYLKNDINLGPILTINRGLKIAQGELVTVLGADDWYPENSLKRRLSVFENREIEAVHAGITKVEKTGRKYIPPVRTEEIIKIINFLKSKTRKEGINLATFVYRKEVFKKIGFPTPNPEIFPHEDYEFGLRVLANCKVVSLNLNSCYYEIHRGSHSQTFGQNRIAQERLKKLEADYLKLLLTKIKEN